MQFPALPPRTRNRKSENLVGKVFGKWTVIESIKVAEVNRRRTMWKCRCSCGCERLIETKTLKNDKSRSCGCSKITHGLTTVKGKHPVYIAWVGMWTRCTNQKEPSWLNYGGRGISVCKRWEDPLAFIEDMMPTWKKGLMLDRINNNGNYTPENCRWITRQVQNTNKRNSTWLNTPKGPMALKDAWRAYKVTDYSTVCYRIRKGWKPWEAITTPTRQQAAYNKE